MATYGIIVLLSWLKQRKGSNGNLALVTEPHSPALFYHMLTEQAARLKDLSETLARLEDDNAKFHQAHEREAAKRYRLTKQRQVETLVTIAEMNERIPPQRESA